MMLNVIAYALATLGFSLGVFLIFKQKQVKYGVNVVSISLLIVLGSAIQIDKLFSLNNAFNYSPQQFLALSNDLQQVRMQMNVQMSQSVTVTQQINNVIRNVTEVRTEVKKEVADVRELIEKFYERSRAEFINGSDTNRVVFSKRSGGCWIGLLLKDAPVKNSVNVLVSAKSGIQISLKPDSYYCVKNSVGFLLDANANPRDYNYTVTYTKDTAITDLLHGLEFVDDKMFFR